MAAESSLPYQPQQSRHGQPLRIVLATEFGEEGGARSAVELRKRRREIGDRSAGRGGRSARREREREEGDRRSIGRKKRDIVAGREKKRKRERRGRCDSPV